MSTEVTHRAYREWELVVFPGQSVTMEYWVTLDGLSQAFTDRWVVFDGSPEAFFFDVGPGQFPPFGVGTGFPVEVTIADQHAVRRDQFDVRRVVTWRNNGSSVVKVLPHLVAAPPWD